MTDLSQLSKEELIELILSKKKNKNDKLLENIDSLLEQFTKNTDLEGDTVFQVLFYLQCIYSTTSIPIAELLGEIDGFTDEEIRKVLLPKIKKLVGTEDFKTRKKRVKENLVEVVEVVETVNPLEF